MDKQPLFNPSPAAIRCEAEDYAESAPRNFLVDSEGYYGEFGGAYIPEILHRCVENLRENYLRIMQSDDFRFPDGHQETHPITSTYRVEQALRDFLARFSVEGDFCNYCGLYGYTSFNAVRYFEEIPIKDSRESKNDAPDMLYILYRYLIIFNDFRNEMMLLEMLAPGEEENLDNLQRAIHNRNFTAYDFKAVGPVTSPLSDEDHKANIRKGIAHCLRGDVFQIVLSRRFVQQFQGDDFKLYRALRSINPSPYLFYFDFGGFRIFGSSPETHCRIDGRKATIDPIAGTTRRTGDPK